MNHPLVFESFLSPLQSETNILVEESLHYLVCDQSCARVSLQITVHNGSVQASAVDLELDLIRVLHILTESETLILRIDHNQSLKGELNQFLQHLASNFDINHS